MNINSLYKKEGIANIQKMSKNEVQAIAKDIAIKLCLAFPEHNLNRQIISEEILSINMFRATMKFDLSGAKYLADTNSIYFNNELEFEDLPEVAMHECIHFLQTNSSKMRMGLYDFYSGLALNEAAVQLMASYANMCIDSDEKLYGICLKTNSPKYYPLECAIVKQMAYFTGLYPLYSSTLYSNDIFAKTFISRFNKHIYNYISKNLDKLLSMENDLHFFTTELATATRERAIKSLNMIIQSQKNDIKQLFFKIQNYIIKNCFCIEFQNITNSAMLYNFKNQLYEFKNYIGYNNDYTFYNEFYCDMMNMVELKRKQISKSKVDTIQPTALIIVDKKSPSLLFLRNTLNRIKKFIGLDVVEIN